MKKIFLLGMFLSVGVLAHSDELQKVSDQEVGKTTVVNIEQFANDLKQRKNFTDDTVLSAQAELERLQAIQQANSDDVTWAKQNYPDFDWAGYGL